MRRRTKCNFKYKNLVKSDTETELKPEETHREIFTVESQEKTKISPNKHNRWKI